MTFYQELRNFFLKTDPGRVRLAKKIAATYSSKAERRAVMNRLREVYAMGGPEKLEVKPKAVQEQKVEAPAENLVQEEIVDEVTEVVEENNEETQEETQGEA